MIEEHTPSLESLLTFPIRFPIKIMGKNTPEFRTSVEKIANECIPAEDLLTIDEKLSKNKQYLSCTIVAIFHDKPAIDRVYHALTANPHVLMAL